MSAALSDRAHAAPDRASEESTLSGVVGDLAMLSEIEAFELDIA